VPADARLVEANEPGPNASTRRSFSLIDQHGQAVTDADFRGQWLVVFFGFMHCADFCPATLFKLRQTLTQLGDDAGKVRVLFITVDPERDTPAFMEKYLKSFGSQFVAGTGSMEQVSAAARTFRTYFQKQPAAADGSYAVDHSTHIYVVNPHGELDRQMSSGATPEQIAAALSTAMGTT
jgi:protein SCO1/2